MAKERLASAGLWTVVLKLGSRIRLRALRQPLSSFTLVAILLILLAFWLHRVSPQAYWGFIDSTVGGVLASLGTYALVQFFFLERESYPIKNWLGFEATSTKIIPSYLEHPSNRAPFMSYFVMPPFDAQAAGVALQILRTAGVRYPARRLVGSHRYDLEVVKDNLVVFCTPERNQLSLPETPSVSVRNLRRVFSTSSHAI